MPMKVPNYVPLAEIIGVDIDGRVILALDEALNPSRGFAAFNLHMQLWACAKSLVHVCMLRRKTASIHAPCALVAACDLETIENCMKAVCNIAPESLQSCGQNGIRFSMHVRHLLIVQHVLNVKFESATAFVMCMACIAVCSMRPRAPLENFARAFKVLRDVHPGLPKVCRSLAQALQWPWPM